MKRTISILLCFFGFALATMAVSNTPLPKIREIFAKRKSEKIIREKKEFSLDSLLKIAGAYACDTVNCHYFEPGPIMNIHNNMHGMARLALRTPSGKRIEPTYAGGYSIFHLADGSVISTEGLDYDDEEAVEALGLTNFIDISPIVLTSPLYTK